MTTNTTITPEILALSELYAKNSNIPEALYSDYDVKRGLRDIKGRGVLVGITEISEVDAFIDYPDGTRTPINGELYYRGYNINDLIRGSRTSNHYCYEESLYLLLFGSLPNKEQFHQFVQLLNDYRELPPTFLRDILMMAPSNNLMNMMARSVLTLYSYDRYSEDISIPNVLRQCLQLTSIFPLLAVYGYQIYKHYSAGDSLVIHAPSKDLSTAENILYMLRPNQKYTSHEAKLLDTCLVLHMEHGGGNNSTFTNHLVTSTGTDTYSAMAASLGSLKGMRHGGANIKVIKMMDDIKEHVSDWSDDDEIRSYLTKIIHKEAFDRTGLIYGMGHAIYSLSDPREVLLRKMAKTVSREKGNTAEFELYEHVSRLAPQVISKECEIHKGVSANVDFFSGYVYHHLLNLPEQLFTPIFAIARIGGWSAHRIEELLHGNKIMRPAYMTVTPHKDYIPMDKR
ncbi:MAG: citrate synthase [Lachnospiraceae bacterium]|jgi:citrate synthase|nr:citrate synthase [Lachnospiraceae bacterium]